MAKIVLGLGTSHSPQCSTPSEQWIVHAERDRRNPQIPYDALLKVRGDSLQAELTFDRWKEKYERCQHGIWRLAEALQKSQPDVVVVVGDDQDELFSSDLRPAVALFGGTHLDDIPMGLDAYHPAIWPAYWARHGNVREAYPMDAQLAEHLAHVLKNAGVDVTWFTTQPENRTLGHAFTFVRRRLMGAQPIPMVPIFINTYYPPNQPTVAQCWKIGRAIREAIESWNGCERVVLIASGGLSHFVIDEALDTKVLDALKRRDRQTLLEIPDTVLISGTSEIRNWIAVGAALQDYVFEVLSYIPAYRSPAGTGMGMAFATWLP